MGQFSQVAWNPNVIPVWPPLHDDVVCKAGCNPLMKHPCATCGRIYQWCYPSNATIDAMKANTWRCPSCGPVPALLEGQTPIYVTPPADEADVLHLALSPATTALCGYVDPSGEALWPIDPLRAFALMYASCVACFEIDARPRVRAAGTGVAP